MLTFSLSAQEIEISGDDGGYVNGKPWKVSDHLGVITTLVYLEPSEENLNTELEDRLNAEGYPIKFTGSVVVISTKQSWMPNLVIEKAVKRKQKQLPTTFFVLDKSNALSNKGWLPKPGYVVVILDQHGKKLYQKEGKFNSADIEHLVELLWDAVYQLEESKEE